MKFTVKSMDGNSKDFELPGETTVQSLKKKVEETMGIPVASQRMLILGKVMADDQPISSYDIDGKVVRVVKSSPGVTKAAPPPSAPAGMRPDKVSYEYLYIGATPENIPPPPETLYLQDFAKDSADNILSTITNGGHPDALVTVTIHTLTPEGRTLHSSTHTSTSHKPGIECMIDPPTPEVSEEEFRRRKEREEERKKRRARLDRYRERVREQQRTGREQTNILEIYQHMTSVRRAIQGAENILEEYLNSKECKEARELLEHHMKLKAEADAREAREAREKELMNGTAGAEKEGGEEGGDKEGASGSDDKGGAAAKKKEGPVYAMGEDGRPRQHILTDTGMLLPAGAHLYAALLDDIVALQKRGIELHEFYAKKIYAEEHYEYEDYKNNSKLVTAVQRYHNAMGQAYASIKKVQVTLEGEPPRIVHLIPSARPTNPLLSLLSAPLDDSDEETTGPGAGGGNEGGGGGGGGGSIAGLLGSLMATRAAMRMMEDEEQNQNQRENQERPAVTSGGEGGGATGGGAGEGGAEKKEDDSDDDDDDINPFLPGPVHLLQQMMKQKQERERQQQQERTVVIQPDQPFFETIARIRQAVGGPEEEIMPPTLIGNLVERCMKKMSISEVVTVFGGVTGPLVTIHPTLREFIKERLLNGEEPTNDNIPQAIESFVSELPAVLNQLQPPLPLREEVDFGASAQKCCAFLLKDVMEIIVNKPDDDPEFPQQIYDWAMNLGTTFTLLLSECLESSNDLTPAMKRISKMMFPDNDTPGVLSMLNSQSLVDKFVEESEKSTIPKETITCHIVYVEGYVEDEDEDDMEVDKKEAEVMQNWPSAMPKEWIPTIQKDQAQIAGQQPPGASSDSYLSSLPAKKRKLEGGEAEETSEQ
ncbi:PREDICTED: uncharacterized protein LOC105313082 isoform X2 [Amphimedon queenslandica]|uniref:Ubiquitin-like domain-containing protein n=1 Tax=Amphimedon queenslandica TaxID=400682 RepID=A0AAN0J969_AMPQE|nr:PREDICTED: uncharacterized protein LOC105313082 isoform X2 [Amphimedon queenslandica]|eukprot:XP_019853287.1 PREDICTED: uncharacterized protein LOC105313082 isoform X2 [Amphimedon queenslandica]